MTDPTAAVLKAAIHKELHCLWYDLHEARGHAANSHWSIRCDSLAERIRDLSTLVGPTSWDEIQLPLLEDGTYQRLHAEWGIDAPVDMARVVQTRAWIDERVSCL